MPKPDIINGNITKTRIALQRVSLVVGLGATGIWAGIAIANIVTGLIEGLWFWRSTRKTR